MSSIVYSLITGASRGFGKALAIECARRGMNLILVSLPGEQLADFSAQLRATYQVDVFAIEKNLCGDLACQELFHEIDAMQLNINMLINNAGVGGTALFTDEHASEYENQIRLNVLATTLITHLFIDKLRKSSPAFILNVGSLASFFSLAKKQVYGATKSYISYFSRSLRSELRKDHISVSVICPGGMYTNETSRETIRTGNLISRASCMQPEDVAPIAIDGLLRRKAVIVPGGINRALVFLDRWLPRFVVRFLEARTMRRLHAPSRNAGLQERPLGAMIPEPYFHK